jgi:hypothetical protein
MGVGGGNEWTASRMAQYGSSGNYTAVVGRGAKVWRIYKLVTERYRRCDKQITLRFSIWLTLETAVLHSTPRSRGLGLDPVADIRSQTVILLQMEQLRIPCAVA